MKTVPLFVVSRGRVVEILACTPTENHLSTRIEAVTIDRTNLH